MEGSRLQSDGGKQVFKIHFSFSMFPKLKNLRVGDKGSMDVSGVIKEERLEDDDKIKTIEIDTASINKQAR